LSSCGRSCWRRAADFPNPNGWQPWSGGAVYEALADLKFQTFLPQINGAALNAAPPQLIHDTVTQRYVLIHTLSGGSNAVYYMTTASLANPSWSDSVPIAGTAQLTTDPAGPVQGSTTPTTLRSWIRLQPATTSNSPMGIRCCSTVRFLPRTAEIIWRVMYIGCSCR
jgi:hypothetical protein